MVYLQVLNRRNMGSLLCAGCGVSVWGDEDVLRRNGGDACTAVWMYIHCWMPANSQRIGAIYVCVFLVVRCPVVSTLFPSMDCSTWASLSLFHLKEFCPRSCMPLHPSDLVAISSSDLPLVLLAPQSFLSIKDFSVNQLFTHQMTK